MRETPTRHDSSPRALAEGMEVPRRGVYGRMARHPRIGGVLVALFALAATVISTVAVNGLPFQSRHVMKVTLPGTAPLLKAGDEVRIAGRRVGTVASVTPRGERAEARLELDRDPGDLQRARVRLRGFAGAVYVELTRGEEGAVASADLPRVVASFDAATRAALARTLTGVGGGLAGRGESLNGTLAAAPDAVEDITPLLRAARPAPELIAPARTVTQALAPGLGDLVTAAAGFSEPLADEAGALGATIEALPGVEARAQAVLPQADPLLADAGAAARELEPAVVALGELLPDALALERDADKLADATALLADARPVLAAARPVVADRARWTAATLAPIASPTGSLARALIPYRFELLDAPAGFDRWGGFSFDEGQGSGHKAVRFSMVFTCGSNRDPYPAPGEALEQRAPCLSRPDPRRARGAVVLIALAILIALAVIRPNPFANPYEVRALFTDAGGLAKIGAEVRIAGTPAGKVTGRERRGDLALVTMELTVPEDTVRTDATAELRPRLLFEGTAYVDIDPGSPQAAALGDSALPIAQTRTAVSVADALGMLDAPTREALQTGVRELADAGAPEAMNNTLGELPQVIRDGGTVAEAARGEDADGLRRAVAGFGRTARAVAIRREDLIPLAAGLERTAAAADQPELDRALAGLPATVADVRTGGDAATRLLAALDPLAEELVPGAERLAPTLDAVRPVARAATPVLREAGPLVDDARVTLATAADASPDLQELVEATSPVLATLDGGLLDALERETALGTPAYLSFLGLFAGGGGASRPFQPGQGHFMRFGFRFLTGAGAPVPPCTLLAGVSPQLAENLAQVGGCQE